MFLTFVVYIGILIIVFGACYCQHVLNKYVEGMYRSINSGSKIDYNWGKEVVLTMDLIIGGLCAAILILLVYTLV